MNVSQIFLFYLLRVLYRVPWPNCCLRFCLLCVQFFSSLHILDTVLLPNVYLVKIFNPLYFAIQKAFSLNRLELLLLDGSYTIRVLIRKSFPMPINAGIFPILSSTIVKVSGFMLRSLVHLELRFCMVSNNDSISFKYPYKYNYFIL